jgi:hypothetical protein
MTSARSQSRGSATLEWAKKGGALPVSSPPPRSRRRGVRPEERERIVVDDPNENSTNDDVRQRFGGGRTLLPTSGSRPLLAGGREPAQRASTGAKARRAGRCCRAGAARLSSRRDLFRAAGPAACRAGRRGGRRWTVPASLYQPSMPTARRPKPPRRRHCRPPASDGPGTGREARNPGRARESATAAATFRPLRFAACRYLLSCFASPGPRPGRPGPRGRPLGGGSTPKALLAPTPNSFSTESPLREPIRTRLPPGCLLKDAKRQKKTAAFGGARPRRAPVRESKRAAERGAGLSARPRENARGAGTTSPCRCAPAQRGSKGPSGSLRAGAPPRACCGSENSDSHGEPAGEVSMHV